VKSPSKLETSLGLVSEKTSRYHTQSAATWLSLLFRALRVGAGDRAELRESTPHQHNIFAKDLWAEH